MRFIACTLLSVNAISIESSEELNAAIADLHTFEQMQPVLAQAELADKEDQAMRAFDTLLQLGG